jgi:mono/diheme cytochrome c family protein
MTFRRLAPALLASLALAACGGDDGGGGGGGGDSESAPKAGTPAETFANTCGGCHTLKAAGTSGQVGPNLDDLKPDAERVKTAIKQGPSVMPENLLKGAQADEVAQYVAENAGG